MAPKVIVVPENPPVPPKPDVEPAEPRTHAVFPPDPKTLKGAAKDRIEIWAHQSKTHTISLCKKTQGEQDSEEFKRCYFPIQPLRDATNGNQPLVKFDRDGKKYIAGVCSFDPDHHGEQRIYPPKKDDEL